MNNRLNIIKYLTSKHSNVHQTSLISIINSLIVSVIDYGLAIYGQCSKHTFAPILSSYHSAIRRSLRAFPTTPIKNLLAEAGLPELRDRVEQNILRLIPKLYISNNPILNKDMKSSVKRTRNLRLPSTICRVAEFAKEIDIPLKPILTTTPQLPPWSLAAEIFITRLLDYSKLNTPPTVFRKMFIDIENQWCSKGWKFIYTDGSKDKENTSFAVVSDKGELINIGLLFPFSSIFTAEMLAIRFATNYASTAKGKYIICTDSKASINALQNLSNKEPLIEFVRTKLNKFKTKIKLMWVPGHCGILGNERADLAAKNVSGSPSIYNNITVKADISRYLNLHIARDMDDNWSKYQHAYTAINPDRKKSILPPGISAQQSKIYTRCRLGHTKVTHEYLLLGKPRPSCSRCHCTLSINHILDFCPKFSDARKNIFQNDKPSDLLKKSTLENIKKIHEFIYQTKLLYEI